MTSQAKIRELSTITRYRSQECPSHPRGEPQKLLGSMFATESNLATEGTIWINGMYFWTLKPISKGCIFFA